ncbi:hypothetical protein PTE30175_01981 [Pandoraea terrae]|uniref:Uncharacterized protein n=1 Tax=Pandoraea terrae TaxID=1537710 RepID=A0A5E4UI47_9BURK|nr:hypothetical protein [Pandoraea terrae]VVD99541.1 hypothetical protein PTE30175_01981 [Pandoraea terrae]
MSLTLRQRLAIFLSLFSVIAGGLFLLDKSINDRINERNNSVIELTFGDVNCRIPGKYNPHVGEIVVTFLLSYPDMTPYRTWGALTPDYIRVSMVNYGSRDYMRARSKLKRTERIITHGMKLVPIGKHGDFVIYKDKAKTGADDDEYYSKDDENGNPILIDPGWGTMARVYRELTPEIEADYGLSKHQFKEFNESSKLKDFENFDRVDGAVLRFLNSLCSA